MIAYLEKRLGGAAESVKLLNRYDPSAGHPGFSDQLASRGKK